MRNSMQPMELTPSTNSSAGCFKSSSNARTVARSLVTPVAVSLWVRITALISCAWSALKISRYRSMGTPSPQVTSTSITCIKCRRHKSTHSKMNCPKFACSILSPGDKVFVTAASHPPGARRRKKRDLPGIGFEDPF